MKGIKSKTRTVALANNATTASGANRILDEVDLGTTRNGLLIINVDIDGTEYVSDISFASSYTSDAYSAGTAVPSSDVNTVVADNVNSSNSVSVSNNAFKISDDGVYIFNVQDVRRYANLQYDCSGTSTRITVNFVGLDLQQAPHADATTEY